MQLGRICGLVSPAPPGPSFDENGLVKVFPLLLLNFPTLVGCPLSVFVCAAVLLVPSASLSGFLRLYLLVPGVSALQAGNVTCIPATMPTPSLGSY